jgi:hypothetical protein
MTAVGMLIIGAGILLLWSAIKGRDPRELVKGVLRG